MILYLVHHAHAVGPGVDAQRPLVARQRRIDRQGHPHVDQAEVPDLDRGSQHSYHGTGLAVSGACGSVTNRRGMSGFKVMLLLLVILILSSMIGVSISSRASA